MTTRNIKWVSSPYAGDVAGCKQLTPCRGGIAALAFHKWACASPRLVCVREELGARGDVPGVVGGRTACTPLVILACAASQRVSWEN